MANVALDRKLARVFIGCVLWVRMFLCGGWLFSYFERDTEMTLTIFPYQSSAAVPHCEKYFKLLRLQHHEGEFLVTPFFGIQLPDGAGCPSVSTARTEVRRLEKLLFVGGDARLRQSTAGSFPLTTMRVGIGIHWWMGEEVTTEFFGFDHEPHTSRCQVCCKRIMRAWHALRMVPVIDTRHDDSHNTLRLCWAIARDELPESLVEGLSRDFGVSLVLRLIDCVQAFRQSEDFRMADGQGFGLEQFLRHYEISTC